MLLCKQQVNEGLTLHAPMERACNEIAYNHRKQGASALGFAWDHCSEMGTGNVDTTRAVKCISLSATPLLGHLEAMFLIYIFFFARSSGNRKLTSVVCLWEKTHCVRWDLFSPEREFTETLTWGKMHQVGMDSTRKDKVRTQEVEEGGWPPLFPRGHRQFSALVSQL